MIVLGIGSYAFGNNGKLLLHRVRHPGKGRLSRSRTAQGITLIYAPLEPSVGTCPLITRLCDDLLDCLPLQRQ